MAERPAVAAGAALSGERLAALAHALAYPRYPGTAGDRRAIAFVERELRERGLEVEVEEFSYDIRPAFLAIRAVLVASAALVAGAAWGARGSPALALSALAAAVLAGGLLLVWAPGAERLYARDGATVTANVTGWRRVRSPRLRLVIMAHHDSKSQNLAFPARMGLTLTAILGGLALAGLLATAVFRGAPPGSWWPVALVGGATALALLALSTLASGNDSPGGVDNAGSVGIVLGLAGCLPREIADDVELAFLSTGAEEDHMVGAMRWLRRHRRELEAVPTLALNFDGAGAPGKLVLIERYGVGRPLAPTLTRLAREAARRLGLPFRSITMLPAMGVDAIPFAHAGVECLTVSSGSLDRATISVHSAADVADHLDPATLERAARLGRQIALDAARRP